MMEISTKGRYSLRIMAFLASRPAGHAATKIEIAAAERASPAYVQQLMTRLAAAGLVNSLRGRRGGFTLARPAETIAVQDVLRASEGEVQLVPCRNATARERATDCRIRPFWMQVTGLIEQLYPSTTIAQLAVDRAGNGSAESERPGKLGLSDGSGDRI
jgi:Rrf2 family protein